MVFRKEELNHTNNILFVNSYHKYWQDREDRMRNPLFDLFSSKILDVKEGKTAAIEFFSNILEDEINKEVTICVVPPSSGGTARESGIGRVAERLVSNGRKDGIDYLERVTPIMKLAYGGSRNKEIHQNSIRFNADNRIDGEVILLMDDVTTSGNSLEACRQILLNNGATNVEMLALGKTAVD